MPAGACINSPFSGPADCVDDNSLQTAKQKKLKSPQCTFPPAKYWKIPGLMVDLVSFETLTFVKEIGPFVLYAGKRATKFVYSSESKTTCFEPIVRQTSYF